MDKLRKIGQWIWRNKERMVLVIMVGVLIYQVTAVVFPDEIPTPKMHTPPTAGSIVAPTPPVQPAPPPLPPSMSALVSKNPFWVYGSTSTTNATGEEDAGIQLVSLTKTPDGKWMARLRTKSTNNRWYREGDSFETFVLRSIDGEGQAVVVYSEKLGKDVTLTLQK